jgi:hypothetical protein
MKAAKKRTGQTRPGGKPKKKASTKKTSSKAVRKNPLKAKKAAAKTSTGSVSRTTDKKMAAKKPVRKTAVKQTDLVTDHLPGPGEISRLAILQNKAVLKANHKNIEALSDTLKKGKHVVAIYLRDHDTKGFPKELQVLLPDGSFARVKTEIVAGAGEAAPHIGQASDEISDANSNAYMGTICCLVGSAANKDFRGAVTSGHIFTYGDCFDYGGVLPLAKKRKALINQQPKAELFFQQMTYNQDLAIAELTDKTGLLDNYRSFSQGSYAIKDSDLKSTQPNVTIISRENNVRDAWILDYNVSFEVKYFNMAKEISNIVLIGSTNDRNTSKTVSVGGDSGSAVYHKKTGRLIGMLLGGNEKFSFVLPLEETLQAYDFKIL